MVLNGLWRRAASAGLAPRRLSTLEVQGRRTGRLISFPVVVADYQDERYLVAMLGERVNWVANVRAAGGKAVLRHGGREAIHLEEIEVRVCLHGGSMMCRSWDVKRGTITLCSAREQASVPSAVRLLQWTTSRCASGDCAPRRSRQSPAWCATRGSLLP
jgi:hypothetical protein